MEDHCFRCWYPFYRSNFTEKPIPELVKGKKYFVAEVYNDDSPHSPYYRLVGHGDKKYPSYCFCREPNIKEIYDCING